MSRTIPAWLLATTTACAGASAPVDQRPDVLILLVDTLRADRVGAWGWPRDSSERLDRRVAQGVRFARAWAPSSWTRPSVGTLLTGRLPPHLGITDEASHGLPAELPTLAETLAAQGYVTCGATANPNLNARFGFDRGFQRYSDSTVVFPWMQEDKRQPSTHTEHLPTGPAVYQAALDCAEAHPNDPVFLFVDVMEVHEYARGPEGILTRPDLRGHYGAPFGEYDDAVRTAADQADAFLQRLSATSGWNNGVVVFLSDHGEGLGSHPSVPGSGGHGLVLYRSNLHVPLAFWGTAVAGLQDVPDDVGLVDVPSTVLELTQTPALAAMDGQSLVPQMRGAPAEKRTMGAWTRFQGVDLDAVWFDDWLCVTDSTGGLLELQPRMGDQDGSQTDQKNAHPAVLSQCTDTWQTLAQAHPWRTASMPSEPLSPPERRQLEQIGYLDGKSEP